MRRTKQRATRYPGVWSVGSNWYRIRGRTKDPKTGLLRELDRVIEAGSATLAAKTREQVLAEKTAAPPERIRLKDYAASWLLGRGRTLKASTVDRYAATIDGHIVPVLGDYYIDAITHQDVVLWRDAQDAAPGTVNSRLRVLKTILASATIDLDLPRDPAHRVQAVRDVRFDEDGALLTAAELHAFLAAARAAVPDWYPLLSTLAFTAMRVGEATALRWDDIDEAAGVIRVRRAQWRGVIGATKTDTRRTVPLPEQLLATLREHRRALVANQAPGLASGWVFPAARRRKKSPDAAWPPINTQSVRKPLITALAATKLEGRISVHGLRRTWNNLLRQVTAGEVVRAITGHVTERMTEHYSHVANSEKAQAATRALAIVTPASSARTAEAKVGTSVGTADPQTTTAGEASL